jgi:hypothetical protein
MSTITNTLTVQEWTVLYETFKTEKNPDTDVLRRFLDAPYNKTFTSPERDKWYHDYMYALRIKLESLTKLERIEAVLDVYDTIKSDVFFEYLKPLIEANEYYFYTLVWDLKLNYRKAPYANNL